jgi:hypothetical protein
VPALFTLTPGAAKRTLEFFTAIIRNSNFQSLRQSHQPVRRAEMLS